MLVSKCDICNKESKKHLVVGTAYFHCMELCYDCGKPALDILIEHDFRFLPDELRKKNKISKKKA